LISTKDGGKEKGGPSPKSAKKNRFAYTFAGFDVERTGREKTRKKCKKEDYKGSGIVI